MNSNMANIPTVNGTDSPEMNHSVFNPSQAQVGSSTSTVPQGFNIIPLASQPLVPFAWTSNANYIDRMTEVAARRFQCQQQQQMNEMGLLPAIANRLPIYIPATALGGIPVYDIQTIIGRHFMDCRQNPDTINPVVQAPMIHNTVTLPGRRMYERIKSCPDTVRLVTGYESQGTVIPYKAVQNAYFQDSTQHVPPHNVFVTPGPSQQLLGNHVLGGCRESVGNAQISSTVTTITECRYDSADHRPDTLIPCSKTEYCKDFPSLFKNVPGEADTFEVTVSPTERLPQVQQTSNPDQTPLQFGEMQDKPLENGVHSNAMSSCVQQSHTSPSLFAKPSESVEALKPNQDPVMSSSPSLVAKPSESVEALKPNQDPVMSSSPSLVAKPSESVEALKPNQDPVMSSSPSLVAKPSESAEALKPNQDPVMSLLPSLFAKPRESVSALKPNQDPLMPKHENGAKEGERFSEKRSESKSERTRPKIVTEVKMPEYSPSKSYNFIKSILCEDVGQRFQADPSKKKEYKLTRTESATELPFSILTIREQRDYLKRTEDAFVQDAPCYDIARMYGVETSGPLLSTNSWRKCRECRSAKQKESLAVFCRFYGFRKLRFQDNLLCTAGFLYPEDCVEKDLQLWLPQKQCFWEKSKDTKDVLSPNDPLDQTMCDFILLNIEKMFCDIVIRERKALTWVEKKEMIRWKKPVAGVREMCDVCETTLFNMHWICRVCGYGVCLDCYERRMSKSISDQEFYDGDKSNCFRWARCTKGKNHFHFSMVPTQIIPSTCLLDLSDMVHSICAARSIKTFCPCQKEVTSSKICAKLDKRCDHRLPSGKSSGTKGSEVNNSKNRKRKNSNSSSDPQTSADSCRPKSKESKLTSPSENMDLAKQPTVCLVDLLSKESWENNADVAKDSAQQRNWLCEGKLLQLTDSQHPNNIDIFKLHWKFGMPVLVSGVGKYLNMELWLPNQLSREYGDANSKNSLVNCITGSIVTNMKIRDFWDGFENISQRLLDENKKTMILKLKDWPPTESFHDVMPEVYEDLMRALPLPEYTFINGKCNLASRLPHFFVKPDLGPKMYNAYGWVTEKNWKQGTTNLHLDVSDAVNIMVYVGIPMDEPPEARNTLLEIISEGEVDDIQYKRALVDKPGALWHIFHVNDVDKIRKFIRQVCAERGETLAADHDPIHDQQMYLDKELRNRLKQEYNVEGYAILQCQGDGVFIPAGAPHQVFNLHSCIKIAEDFVSPEHVDKCFALTNEFRYLSSTHSNHEDKLQIKNIIYHSVKDIVSSAMHAHCA